MGQLIKLQDYISRYELDMYHYPSEFIRLKRKQWERMKHVWETGQLAPQMESRVHESWKWLEEGPSFFDKIKRIWKREKVKDVTDENEQSQEEEDFMFSIPSEPRTIEELKILFLEKLFQLQIRWASSTLTEESVIDPKYYYDAYLKYFLQRFPDTYLCMYKPVFLLKKAPVELNTILISPTTTWCVAFTQERKNNIIVGSAERFWTEIVDNVERKIVNPMISLHRTEKVVQTIYKQFSVDMPIKKVLINREGYIDYRYAPSDLDIVDRRHYETWFMSLRQLTMPLKHTQLKAAQSLLTYCDTRYYDPLVIEEIEEADE